jgi:peroxiredoxin
MKKIIISILSILLISACGNNAEEGITISGTVKNPPAEGGKIEIERYADDGVEVVGEVSLNGNEFSYKADTLPAGFYRINFFDTQFVQIIVDESDIKLTVDGGSPTGDVEITGSPEMDFVEKIKTIYSEMQEEIQETSSQYSQAELTKEKEEELYGELIELQREYSEKIKAEIDNIGANLAALNAVSYLNPDEDFTYIENLATRLKEAYPDNKDVATFAKQVDDLKALSSGAEAPDFTLSTPDNEQVSLSSFQGNYVLLDFWAAWCKPCRMENPNLVEVYKMYEEEGFEILGVSLDQNDEPWIEAVEKDELIWTQVRDKNNEVAQTYQIQAIPANFLLNKEGEIVAKNLRGNSLRQKLAEIYNR